LRVAKQTLLVVLTPLSVGTAQLSAGVGPVGQLSSTATAWRTSAQLWGTARFENPFTSSVIVGEMQGGNGALRLGSLSGRQELFTPAVKGLRMITAIDFEQGDLIDPEPRSALSAASSLSYRNGMSGTWAGFKTERNSTAALRVGGWRQLGNLVTVAISSSLRRGTYGATGPRSWIGTYLDSVKTDSGWVHVQREGVFGDSGSTGRKVSWLETEAKMGWSKGRVALDGVLGWRPAIDSARGATWFRAITTVAVSRSVSLSAGVGTRMQQIPYARSTGRYASVALRLAPAALVRPRETPEITSAASSFRIDRAGDQCIIRVRLPQARVVELSGDFNGWQPVRLTREVNGTWVASLALKPGAYRMNIRVDGEAWLPPPGVAAVDDEFNGKVGLIVVR
jgi:hypothetical protein